MRFFEDLLLATEAIQVQETNTLAQGLCIYHLESKIPKELCSLESKFAPLSKAAKTIPNILKDDQLC